MNARTRKKGEQRDFEQERKILYMEEILQEKNQPYQGKDGRWYVYVPDVTKESGRRKIAKKSYKDLLEEMMRYYQSDSREVPTLKEAYPKWQKFKAIDKSSSSLKRWNSDWEKFYLNEPLSRKIINTKMDRLDFDQIKAWGVAIIRKYDLTEKSWKGVIGILSNCYKYLINKKILTHNPATGLGIAKKEFRKVDVEELERSLEDEVYKPEEVQLLIGMSLKLAEKEQDEVWYAIPLIYYLGLRLGEVNGLHFSDYRENSHSFYVHRSFCVSYEMDEDGQFGKQKYQVEGRLKQNSDPRFVPVTDNAMEIINLCKAMKEGRGDFGDRMFDVNSPGNIECKLEKLCKLLGIKHRSPQKLRRTFASVVFAGTADTPGFVQAMMGHLDIKTTMTYYVKPLSTMEEQKNILQSLLDNDKLEFSKKTKSSQKVLKIQPVSDKEKTSETA